MKQVLPSSNPSGSTSTKRRKRNVSNTKGFCYVNSDLSSSLDLDHWEYVLEDYLGTDFGVNSILSLSFVNSIWRLLSLGLFSIKSGHEREPNRYGEFSGEANRLSTRNSLIQLVPSEKEPRNSKFNRDRERRFIQHVLPLVAAKDVVDSEEEQLIAFSSSNRCQASSTFESPSAFLTPLEDILVRPT